MKKVCIKEFIDKVFIDKEFVDKEFVGKEFVDKELVGKEFVDKEFVVKEFVDKAIKDDWMGVERRIQTNYVTYKCRGAALYCTVQYWPSKGDGGGRDMMTVERTGGSGSSEENRPHTAQPAKYRTQIIRQKFVLPFFVRFFSK